MEASNSCYTINVLKAKACLQCRTRKVKCDRKTPCTNCLTWSLECVFPSPTRTCSRPKKQSKCQASSSGQSIEDRIESLERELVRLRTDVSTNAIGSGQGCDYHRSVDISRHFESGARRLEALETIIDELLAKNEGGNFNGYRGFGCGRDSVHCTSDSLKGITSWPRRRFPYNTLLFEPASRIQPSLSHIHFFWKTYLQSIDPLVKVLHKPSAEKILRKATTGRPLNSGEEALIHAIHFAALYSIDDTQSQTTLGLDKPTAIKAFESTTEDALMRGDFLNSNDLNMLQAAVLFLSFNRFMNEAKLVLAFTCLAKQLVYSVGSAMTPFEQEMRRRLWWHAWYLDQRAAEDHGRDISFPGAGTVPSFPFNVNDSDLDPRASESPAERLSWTDMSFSLMLLAIGRTSSSLENMPSLDEKESRIRECERHLETNFLGYCDGSDSIHWLARHVGLVLTTELRFRAYGQYRPSLDTPTIHATRDRLFFAAIDFVDIPKWLDVDPAAQKWKWLLDVYLQFVPLAFLLTELTHRANCAATGRAWLVAEAAFVRWGEFINTSKNGKALIELMVKAREQRDRAAEWQMLADMPSDPIPSNIAFGSEIQPLQGLDLVLEYDNGGLMGLQNRGSQLDNYLPIEYQGLHGNDETRM